jgi:glycosyltransferase involved in cell wall biosynthesis
MAFISMHPAPYRDAFIEKLVQNNPKKVDVFNYLSSDKGHDFWGLEASTFKVEELGGSKLSFFRMTFKLLRMFVFSRKYDFVMWPGWTYKPLFIPIFLSALFRKKFGFSADTVKQGKISKIGFILKRFVVNRAKIILVPGEAGRLFFSKTFDTDTNKILKGAYALDGNRIEIEILKRRKNFKCSIRNKYDINEKAKVFLMVANMIPTRHYPITVSAFVEVAKQNKNAVFVIVGIGDDLKLMQEISLEEKSIKVIPGCSFDEMLSLYAMSDVYVHGGTEPASTALVIGAISHLPLISSMAVGCAKDVLVDGETGVLVYDYKSVALWKAGFDKILKSEDLWDLMGEKARTLSKRMDVDVCVNQFIDVVSSLC